MNEQRLKWGKENSRGWESEEEKLGKIKGGK